MEKLKQEMSPAFPFSPRHLGAAWREENITHTKNSSSNSSTRRPALRTVVALHEHKYDQRTIGFHQKKMQDSVRDNRGDAWILPGLGEKDL